MATSAWVITKDNTESNIVGVSRGKMDAAEIKANGRKFRMVDDDGEIYCYGYFWAADIAEGLGESAFSPLDDFGMPSLGATSIQYKNMTTGEYEEL